MPKFFKRLYELRYYLLKLVVIGLLYSVLGALIFTKLPPGNIVVKILLFAFGFAGTFYFKEAGKKTMEHLLGHTKYKGTKDNEKKENEV